jgi:hypothetical protein
MIFKKTFGTPPKGIITSLDTRNTHLETIEINKFSSHVINPHLMDETKPQNAFME